MEKPLKGWEDLIDALLVDINSGMYRADQRLPGEYELADRFGVTRADVRKAYDRLKEFGYVYSIQGKGSFFRGPQEIIPLRLRGGSFSHKMKELGLPYESRNIMAAPIPYTPLVFEPLGAAREDKVWEIVRLRIISGEPVAIHTSFLPERVFPGLPQDGERITSVFSYFEETGQAGHKGEGARISVGSLTRREREVLGVAGYAPCLVYSGRRFAQDGQTVLEFMRTVYRADRFCFLL